VPEEETSRIARFAWCCAGSLAVFALLALGPTAHLGLALFYVVPVALATWWFDWRLGVAFALACTALYALDDAIEPVSHFGPALLGVRLLILCAVVAGTAALRRRVQSLEHSAEELEAIRMALTPPALPTLPGVDAAAAFIPSELGVSGDFYLLTNGPDGATIAVVGDVVGHGPKAARLATFIRARLAMLAANSSDPAEILALANTALLERPGRRDELVSAVCLSFDSRSGRLALAVAGHPPPLRLPELEAMAVGQRTMLLGVEADFRPLVTEAQLDSEAGVLVYTDGATDLRLEGEALLGLEGLRRLLAPIAGLRAERLVAAVEETLLETTQGAIRDDICVLVLRPTAVVAAAS
jgi:serine phosphatase RsbU (regulator of sigma subunit)